MNNVKAFAIGLLAIGCASTPDICAQRKGTYVLQYAERDGNCGPIDEIVETLETQPVSVPDGCKGTITYSADNCAVTSDATCPTTGGQDLRVNGKTTWDTLGDKGNGTQQMTLTKGDTVVCRSTYNVTARRQ